MPAALAYAILDWPELSGPSYPRMSALLCLCLGLCSLHIYITYTSLQVYKIRCASEREHPVNIHCGWLHGAGKEQLMASHFLGVVVHYPGFNIWRGEWQPCLR